MTMEVKEPAVSGSSLAAPHWRSGTSMARNKIILARRVAVSVMSMLMVCRTWLRAAIV